MQPSAPTASAADVERWLRRLGRPKCRLTPLAGDVSARRYLRARSGEESLIVAVYPATLRNACERFLATGELLRRAGVRVPAVIESDCRRGLMLLEDLGDTTLYDLRGCSWEELAPWFARAVEDAERIGRLDPARVAHLNPPLDGSLLRHELEQTWRSFLEPRGLIGDRDAAAALRAGLEELCRRLGEEPRVPCHRDFMARNLIPLGENGLGLLDHQDLRLGPPFYDLASLFNDSLFPPPELVEAQLGAAAGELGYRRAVAQRALKTVGTFATFAERGNPRHLGLIPRALERALDQLRRIPETVEVSRRLGGRWREVC